MSARKSKPRASSRGRKQELIYREDWDGLMPGPASAFRTAFGEYHTHPSPPGAGNWGDAVLSTGQLGLAWRVVDDGGELAFEVCQQMPRRPAIMVLDTQGDLRDYTFTVPVRPLSSKAPCGLVFHYQTNRTFFAVLWSGDGQLALVRNDHDARQTLAAAELPFNVDEHCRLSVTVSAMTAKVSADGKKLLEGRMEPLVTGQIDGPRKEGKVGLIGYAPVRFRAAELTCPPPAGVARRSRLSAAQRELDALREENPTPEAVSECSLGDFGAGRNLRLADLDGDGQLEFIIAQQSKRANEGDYCQISCLTAFRANGEVLWQLGTPVRATSLLDAPTWDLPFQVADVDGDGRMELIMCRDWQIQVRDAATGELLRSAPTPRSTLGLTVIGWAVEDFFDRICGDAIHLCDLSGRGRPGEFLIKDRYANLWAYDTETLEPIWHAVLNTGHYPLAFDINGDGRDEVLCGYSLISADGRIIWQQRNGDHVDGIGVGHFDPDRDDFQIAWVAGEEGFFIVGADGRTIACHVTGHLQKMSIGNFLPDRPGVEIATITYWASQGVLSVFDGRGVKLHESEPWHAASAIMPVGWRGDGQDFMLLSTHPRYGGMLDGLGRRAVMFPEGYPHLACDACDIDGCGREEVLAWDFDRLVIFKAAGKPLGKPPARYTGELYNRSNYKANVSVPPEIIAGGRRR